MKLFIVLVVAVLTVTGNAYAQMGVGTYGKGTVAIDSEPILKSSLVAIDSEPILRVSEVAIDSEPILVNDPKAIDSEPILKEELAGMSMIYKKDGKYIKVTYKASKAEAVSDKEGKEREEKGQVQRLPDSKK